MERMTLFILQHNGQLRISREMSSDICTQRFENHIEWQVELWGFYLWAGWGCIVGERANPVSAMLIVCSVVGLWCSYTVWKMVRLWKNRRVSAVKKKWVLCVNVALICLLFKLNTLFRNVRWSWAVSPSTPPKFWYYVCVFYLFEWKENHWDCEHKETHSTLLPALQNNLQA